MQKRGALFLTYYLPTAVFVIACMAVYFFLEKTPVFPVDDAYITLHNAMVLHLGHDPNYAGISALSGTTSPIHLAVVSLLMMFLHPLWALDLAAWLGTLIYALGIVRLAQSHKMSPFPAFLMVLVGLFAAKTPHQLMNGLETGWAMAGITWTLAICSEKGRPAALTTSALAGTLPFLRPELAVLSFLILPLPAWRLWRTTGQWRPSVALLRDCLLAALMASSPWLIWQLAATSSIVPTTVAAKRYWFAESGLPGETKWLWVTGAVTTFLIACGPIALAAISLPFTLIGRAGLAFIMTLLAMFYCVFPGALGHYEGRYLYVFIPVILFGAASGSELLSRWPSPKKWTSPNFFVLLFLLVSVFQAARFVPATWKEHRDAQRFTQSELGGVADWCNENLPQGSRLLIHDAGYISYATHFQLIDMVGLKTPANIEFHKAMTYPSHGKLRDEAISKVELLGNADFLVVLDGWDNIFDITSGLRKNGWLLDPLRMNGAYHVYRIHPDAAFMRKPESTRVY
jgi:uncharacterized membrane protein (UPF0136 family)